MTFLTVVQCLKNHGISLNQQTEALNGVLVEKGTSFLEVFGYKPVYNKKEVMEWLGY